LNGVETISYLLEEVSRRKEYVVVVQSVHENEPYLEDKAQCEEHSICCLQRHSHFLILFLSQSWCYPHNTNLWNTFSY